MFNAPANDIDDIDDNGNALASRNDNDVVSLLSLIMLMTIALMTMLPRQLPLSGGAGSAAACLWYSLCNKSTIYISMDYESATACAAVPN